MAKPISHDLMDTGRRRREKGREREKIFSGVSGVMKGSQTEEEEQRAAPKLPPPLSTERDTDEDKSDVRK